VVPELFFSLTNTSSPDPPFGPVTGNVAAYSGYAEAYEVRTP
jgi:hypothetical protein